MNLLSLDFLQRHFHDLSSFEHAVLSQLSILAHHDEAGGCAEHDAVGSQPHTGRYVDLTSLQERKQNEAENLV